MQYTAKHRFADVGPRKIRQFANLIRGKNVDEALQLLRFYPNRGAKLLLAVVQSAYGNADHLEHPDPDGLVITECRVDGAPTFKRIQPRARGTAFGILRRMSHIIVSLSDSDSQAGFGKLPGNLIVGDALPGGGFGPPGSLDAYRETEGGAVTAIEAPAETAPDVQKTDTEATPGEKTENKADGQ